MYTYITIPNVYIYKYNPNPVTLILFILHIIHIAYAILKIKQKFKLQKNSKDKTYFPLLFTSYLYVWYIWYN